MPNYHSLKAHHPNDPASTAPVDVALGDDGALQLTTADSGGNVQTVIIEFTDLAEWVTAVQQQRLQRDMAIQRGDSVA